MYGYELEGNYYHNVAVRKLMICCDTKSADGTALLQAPPKWADNVGNAIVARADGKDLLPHHVELFLDFIDKVTFVDLKENKKNSRAKGKQYTDRDIVECFSPASFHEFSNQRGHSWMQAPLDDEVLAPLKAFSPLKEKVNPPPEKQIRPMSEEDRAREHYAKASLNERYQMAETWREKVLLEEIAKLQEQLGHPPVKFTAHVPK